MTDTAASAEPVARQPWSKWRLITLERLPIPYWSIVVILASAAAAEQALEYYLSARFPGIAPNFRVGDALVIVGFVIFVMVYIQVLRQESMAELLRLRPSVLINNDGYDTYVRRMLQADWRVELFLLGIGIVIAWGFYARPMGELMRVVSKLWAGPLVEIFVGITYLVLFWLLLMLVYTGIRYGRALSALSRCSLAIDVFDNSHLLPFGRLSLLASLWLVGIVLIPLIILGPPTSGGYLIIGLSITSLFWLFVPIWGVHRQMMQARHKVLFDVHEQFLKVQETLFQSSGIETQNLKEMAERARTLLELHKIIHEAPTWPFARGGGIVKAIVAAASPIIYFFLNQLILNYLILRK